MSKPATLSSVRRQKYKNEARSLDDSRRKREDETVQLRKEKRAEQLAKRRHIVPFQSNSSSDADMMQLAQQSPGDLEMVRHSSPLSQGSSPLALGRELLAGIHSRDDNQVLSSVTRLRQILSKEPTPPIEEVLATGVTGDLVRLLSRQDNKEIQFEAAWAVTNIASGDSRQTRILVASGALPILIQLICKSSYNEVKEQAVWAIGNIAGDCIEFRDMLLSLGVIPPLLAILENNTSLSMRRNVVWTLSNLNRCKNPPPDYASVAPCIPVLTRILKTAKDLEVLADCAWAFSYISDGTNDRIEDLVQVGVIPRLVELLGHKEWSVVAASVRAVGNIVTGDDSQTQAVLDAGVLPLLRNLLFSGKDQLVKETCWTLSNITAGNTSQIEAVFEADCMDTLISVGARGDFKSRKEAIWAITNATSGGDEGQLKRILVLNGLEMFCDALSMDDPKVLIVAMTGLENLLKYGELWLGHDGDSNPIATAVEANGGLDQIEQLQSHPNHEVYKRALGMIEKHFGETNVDLDQQPGEENGMFKFGRNANGNGNGNGEDGDSFLF